MKHLPNLEIYRRQQAKPTVQLDQKGEDRTIRFPSQGADDGIGKSGIQTKTNKNRGLCKGAICRSQESDLSGVRMSHWLTALSNFSCGSKQGHIRHFRGA